MGYVRMIYEKRYRCVSCAVWRRYLLRCRSLHTVQCGKVLPVMEWNGMDGKGYINSPIYGRFLDSSF